MLVTPGSQRVNATATMIISGSVGHLVPVYTFPFLTI